MGCCLAKPVPTLQGADGTLARMTRVQTQYTYDEGGDGMWYTGTVMNLWDDGNVQIRYDDGDKWVGRSVYCYLLPRGHPGHQRPQPYGVPSQGACVTPPGSIGTDVAIAVPVVVVGQAVPSNAVVGRPVNSRT